MDAELAHPAAILALACPHFPALKGQLAHGARGNPEALRRDKGFAWHAARCDHVPRAARAHALAIDSVSPAAVNNWPYLNAVVGVQCCRYTPIDTVSRIMTFYLRYTGL
jgi:hypothetical protein